MTITNPWAGREGRKGRLMFILSHGHRMDLRECIPYLSQGPARERDAYTYIYSVNMIFRVCGARQGGERGRGRGEAVRLCM